MKRGSDATGIYEFTASAYRSAGAESSFRIAKQS
jgi:hypothetical protein